MTDWRELSGPLAAFTLGTGPRIVFVHGFTQTARSWQPIAEHFATAGYEAVLVDLPGHGGSSQVRADLRRGADMLTTMVGAGTYVGYSLGGRFCLHAAVMYPHLVQRLGLIGANPGIADADDRALRRAADDQLAAHMRDIGLEAFVREWTAQPLFGDYHCTDAELLDRLRNTVDGLESSLYLAGTGAQEPLWRRLHELAMPVLAIAGALDQKFADIAEQIVATVTRGTLALTPDAAHAAHLQQPQSVVAAILQWLTATAAVG